MPPLNVWLLEGQVFAGGDGRWDGCSQEQQCRWGDLGESVDVSLRQEAYDTSASTSNTLLSLSCPFCQFELLPLRDKQKITVYRLIGAVHPIYNLPTKVAADRLSRFDQRSHQQACLNVLAEEDEGPGHRPDPEKCQAKDHFWDASPLLTAGPTMCVVAVLDRHQL